MSLTHPLRLCCLFSISLFVSGQLTDVSWAQYATTPPMAAPTYYQTSGQAPRPYSVLQYRENNEGKFSGSTVRPASYHAPGETRLPWYQSLATDTLHDFGTVARSSRQEHIFSFENKTQDVLLLTGIRTSCGCTIPSVLTPRVEPGQTAKIKAVFNTAQFYGRKQATVTVTAQKVSPTLVEYGELQFIVKGQIRRDVVFYPGEVSFGDVIPSETNSRTVQISYAGNPQWKIVGIKTSVSYLKVEAREVARTPQSGRVDYEMTVRLDPSAPTGLFAETISIVTNDPNTNGLSLRVQGRVKPTLEAADIQLGVLNQGQKLEKRWIVRGTRPFTIKEIKTNNPLITFAQTTGKKPLHIVTFTVDTSQPGNIEDQISLVTDLPGQPEATFRFSAQIVPATKTSQ